MSSGQYVSLKLLLFPHTELEEGISTDIKNMTVQKVNSVDTILSWRHNVQLGPDISLSNSTFSFLACNLVKFNSKNISSSRLASKVPSIICSRNVFWYRDKPILSRNLTTSWIVHFETLKRPKSALGCRYASSSSSSSSEPPSPGSLGRFGRTGSSGSSSYIPEFRFSFDFSWPFSFSSSYNSKIKLFQSIISAIWKGSKFLFFFFFFYVKNVRSCVSLLWMCSTMMAHYCCRNLIWKLSWIKMMNSEIELIW